MNNESLKCEEIIKPYKSFVIAGLDLTDSTKESVRTTIDAMLNWMLSQGNLYFRSPPTESVEEDFDTGKEKWSLRFRAAFSDAAGTGTKTMCSVETGNQIKLIKIKKP